MSFDEDFYSRQTAAIGFRAMKTLSKLKIFIYGMNGLGIEIAKNIILSGPEEVTILDNTKITSKDLGTNFYLTKKDIGFRRDEICIKELRKLNSINCNVLKDEEFIKHLGNFNIVIIAKILELSKIEEINKICHQNKIGLIYGLTFGLSFFIFVDFGQHEIYNKNNKDPSQYFIKNIIKGEKTKIIIDTNQTQNLDLDVDSYVIFKEVEGMPNLTDGQKRKIISSTNKEFEIDENSLNYDDDIQGGIIEEVIIPEYINYKSIDIMLNEPNVCEDTMDDEKNLNMHLAFLVIHEFFKKTGKIPENTENDLNNIYIINNDLYKKYREKFFCESNRDEHLLNLIYKYANYELSPICGFAGGIISQEILKFTGIYKPINQWMRYSFYDILQKLEKLNVFIIGAGALGCEILKYLAMMGVSTQKDSILSITDHDIIEKSNLNRQFLFREKDISENKHKAECAISAIRTMNENINCRCFFELVSENSENIFDSKFFKSQDAVILAVDNFEARTYVSKKCEEYKIPYFNCGTEGAYANFGAYMPGITKPASFPKTKKNQIPPCTLKFFPSNITHCVSWSCNHFKNFFNENIKYTKSLYNDINLFFEELKQKKLESRIIYKKIKKYFKLFKISNEKDFSKCIKFSIKKYYKLFINNINNTLRNYPPDKINKITGKKFWIGDKRLPHPLSFNLANDICFKYIKCFSCLLANCLDINLVNVNIDESIKNYCKNFVVNEFPKKKTFEDKIYYDNKIQEMKDKILLYNKNTKKSEINYHIIEYEKDSTDPFQLDFIYSSSILRAENFNIDKQDKFKIKILAGKIMPSLITSSSAISGLLALQLYALCQNNNFKNFKIGMLDLADNTINVATPSLLKDEY